MTYFCLGRAITFDRLISAVDGEWNALLVFFYKKKTKYKIDSLRALLGFHAYDFTRQNVYGQREYSKITNNGIKYGK